MNDLFVRIRFLIPTLPRAEKAIAEALLDNPEAITVMTLAELAKESGSSEASIIRFCRRLGFRGYTEMKNGFKTALDENDEIYTESINLQDNMRTILEKVYKSNVQTLSDTLILADEEYEKALHALVNASKINFFGVGDAYAACQFAYMKFSRLGVACSAHSDVMLQLAEAGNMSEGMVALAISYEGRSRNIVEAMKIAKQNGATTICITKMNKSPLLRYSDINLFIAVNDLTIGRDTVTRRVADQFILDALYLGYTMRKTNKNFKTHLKGIQEAIDRNKI